MAGDAQALRGDEEKLQFAVEVIEACLARGGAVAPGVDALDGDAAALEGCNLILLGGPVAQTGAAGLGRAEVTLPRHCRSRQVPACSPPFHVKG